MKKWKRRDVTSITLLISTATETELAVSLLPENKERSSWINGIPRLVEFWEVFVFSDNNGMGLSVTSYEHTAHGLLISGKFISLANNIPF